jgi:hypothetical protein
MYSKGKDALPATIVEEVKHNINNDKNKIIQEKSRLTAIFTVHFLGHTSQSKLQTLVFLIILPLVVQLGTGMQHFFFSHSLPAPTTYWV